MSDSGGLVIVGWALLLQSELRKFSSCCYTRELMMMIP